MKARITIGSVTYPLCEIKVEDMKVIYDDDTKRNIRAIPQYFDELGRVWPKPPADIAVEFYGA